MYVSIKSISIYNKYCMSQEHGITSCYSCYFISFMKSFEIPFIAKKINEKVRSTARCCNSEPTITWNYYITCQLLHQQPFPVVLGTRPSTFIHGMSVLL